ncbi:hypothetical protein FRC06_005060 [Ceratobasidium sp. 370]|nr:hypothetical protein FRC06_005060 [Ceratobasidium sp. 370]
MPKSKSKSKSTLKLKSRSKSRSKSKSKSRSKSRSKSATDEESDSGSDEECKTRSKGAKKLWAYKHDDQALMFVMRASVQHTYVHHRPWVDSDDVALDRAMVFAKKYTTYDVQGTITYDHRRMMKKTHGQLRTAGQDDIKAAVKAFYRVKEGDVTKLDWLQQHSRCLYPGGNMDPSDFFNTDIRKMENVYRDLQ